MTSIHINSLEYRYSMNYIFVFSPAEFFYIKSCMSGQCLDVWKANTDEGKQINLVTCLKPHDIIQKTSNYFISVFKLYEFPLLQYDWVHLYKGVYGQRIQLVYNTLHQDARKEIVSNHELFKHVTTFFFFNFYFHILVPPNSSTSNPVWAVNASTCGRRARMRERK